MNSGKQNTLDAVLDLCLEDIKFTELVDLFRKTVPDIDAIDFFQPNSKLRKFDSINLTNLHIYALLSFHFNRQASKNRRSAVMFIGTLCKKKNSKPGIHFNRNHVLTLLNLILGPENIIADSDLMKIWDYLDTNFKSCRTEESGRFIGDLKFDRNIIPGLSIVKIPSPRIRPKVGKRPLKRPQVVELKSPSTPCKRPKAINLKQSNNKLFLSHPNKNLKLVYRSTLIRQAARINSLKNQNEKFRSQLTDKEAENVDLVTELKTLQAEKIDLEIKLNKFNDMHENVCKHNKMLNEKLENSKNEIHYLTNKLLYLEEIQNDFDAIEDKFDDPNFEIESEFKKLNEDFENCQEFPQILVRTSIKKINPVVHLGITLIRQIGRVSLENTMPLFLALANSVFGQNWNLGNFNPKKRLRNTLPPSKNVAEKPAKKPITLSTLPAKSFTRSLEKNILEPAALKSSAQAIIDSDVGSLIFDHMSINRGKAITVGVMTGNIDDETDEQESSHHTLSVKQVVDTTAIGTYRSVIEVLRLTATAAAKSGSADDVTDSFKQLLSKLMFQVTDDASQMRPVCEKINELIKLLAIDGEIIFIHCNAHIVPALDAGVTKVLIDVENFLQINDQVVRKFNQSFHKVSNSTIETMVRAIFQFIGDSVKNCSWAMTSEFQTFLDIVAEDGEKNFFKNPDSSKFGLFQEMCFILSYSFENVKEFIDRVYAGNNMYKSCSLYIECPYFKECLLSITLLFYHVTSPFLIAVGAETQYGFSNLSHSELLIFFPKYVECLQELTDDPSPYLSRSRLSYLESFAKICVISKKKYREMFDTIFERIDSESGINIEIVKTTLKLLTEEYLIVIDRQAKEFYIGKDSVIAKQLEKHPKLLDLVATTSLSAEHSVGITRQDLRRAPTALMSTLSAGQVFKSSPLGREILKNKMTPQKLGQIIKETRKSGAQKLKKELALNDANILKSEKKAHFAILEDKRKKIVQKKLDIAAAVKVHGGPLQSPEEVDKICDEHFNKRDVLAKIIALELSYQKDVICNNSVPDSRYRQKIWNNIRKGYDKICLNDRIENLKAIVSPIDQTKSFSIVDPSDFVEKATEKHNEMKKYSHRSSALNDTIKFDDPFFNNLHTQNFVAVYCIEEAEIWYLAKIIDVNQNNDCVDCSPLAVFHGDYPHCFKVQFMDKNSGSNNCYRLEPSIYHVPPSQIIPCLPKVLIKTTKSKNKSLNFVVNNESQIIAALEKNILYAYTKNNNIIT